MDLAKTKRILAKEFTRSPAKTCVLLALLPVAGYFIVPLLLPDGKPAVKSGVAVPVVPAVVSGPAPSVPSTAGASPVASWQQLAAWMQADHRMVPASIVGTRNPFRFPVRTPQVANHEEGEDEQEQAAVEVATDLRHIVLTATLASPGLRLATINGRTYRESEMLRAEEGTDAETGWRVARVGRNFVVLERGGQQHMLRLKPAELAGGEITIVRHASEGTARDH